MANQMEDLSVLLPEYSFLGYLECNHLFFHFILFRRVGRDGGNDGEFNPVLARSQAQSFASSGLKQALRFSILDSGTFWLGHNTEAPGKGSFCSYSRLTCAS
jgi:hypothetical protein